MTVPRQISLPGLLAQGQTALLELDLAPSRIDASQSWIEVRHGELRYRQYFAPRVGARCVLNLSPVFQSRPDGSPVGAVQLLAPALRFDTAGTFHVSRAPTLDGATVMVLAPHPDDAEIACFGLYAGHPSVVVTLTAGEQGAWPAGRGVEPSVAALWRAQARLSDSLTIPRRGGVPPERCINLAYPDGGLERMRRGSPELARPTALDAAQRAALRARNADVALRDPAPCRWEALVQDLARLLEEHRPGIVCCPHPRLDGHEDHAATAFALGGALSLVSGVTPQIFLYVVHARADPLHPVGPSHSVVPPLAWTPGSHGAEAVYSHALDPELRARKLAALASHQDLRPRILGARSLAAALAAARQRLVGACRPRARAESFLRRAPRPNEIYYVSSRDRFLKLLEALDDGR